MKSCTIPTRSISSFSAAARQWGRSKAVVSKYVNALEDHLGARRELRRADGAGGRFVPGARRHALEHLARELEQRRVRPAEEQDALGDEVAVPDAVEELPFGDDLAGLRGEPNQHVNGLTHLWTGKDVKGSDDNSSTVGIAYTGALCDRLFGVGLSEGRNRSFDSLIAAHEIGHNFGAPHDGESPCADVTGDFIMAASLNGSKQFSQCSLDQMADDIARAEVQGCITPLPGVDISFGSTDSTPSVLLGDSATVTFDIINTGLFQATNVMADFTVPANISLDSARASMGQCTHGGGMVSCAIGDVLGTANATVTLTMHTVAVGSGTFDASVTADVDDDPTNNRSSVTLTVRPAVNLSVTPPSAQRIDVGQSIGLTAVLENTAGLDATGVTLSIGLAPGLRADSASWSLGECSVGNGRIDCAGETFAAQSNVIVSVGVTGTSDGTKAIDFTLASAEADTDPVDNSAAAFVDVGKPAGSESSIGGGGAGLWLLPLLGMIARRRRRP